MTTFLYKLPSLALLALLLTAMGCTQESTSHPTGTGPAIGPEGPELIVPSEQEQARRECERQLRSILAEPGLPGAPGFERRRLELLSHAKAEPLLLVDTPTFESLESSKRSTAKGFRSLLAHTQHPWDVIKRFLPNFNLYPENARQTLLRDGYLYSEDPETAFAMLNLLSVEHFFNEPEIWLQRGGATFHAKRRQGLYYFTDGPNAGERVRLLLLDRIGVGTPRNDGIVRDFRRLQQQLYFNRVDVRHITPSHIVANLRYGKLAVPSVLHAAGANMELVCEIVDESMLEAVSKARAEAKDRQRVVQALQRTIALQIEDQLPFDEPRHEYGHQLDGKLRQNWLTAYMAGKKSYAFNGDRYQVYNSLGNVMVPEVCVDFLTDTLERMSGTWFAPKGETPELRMGRLDFNSLDFLERAKLRRVPGFLKYAHEHPEQFEVMALEASERVPLGKREAFADYLLEHSDDYRPGDIVIIRGMTPWDRREMHYHSFFIYENDPLTGVPIALVGNAGRPSVRTWETEARRTPRRSIWYRIRPQTAWLKGIIAESFPLEPLPPPPLSPRGNAG